MISGMTGVRTGHIPLFSMLQGGGLENRILFRLVCSSSLLSFGLQFFASSSVAFHMIRISEKISGKAFDALDTVAGKRQAETCIGLPAAVHPALNDQMNLVSPFRLHFHDAGNIVRHEDFLDGIIHLRKKMPHIETHDIHQSIHIEVGINLFAIPGLKRQHLFGMDDVFPDDAVFQFGNVILVPKLDNVRRQFGFTDERKTFTADTDLFSQRAPDRRLIVVNMGFDFGVKVGASQFLDPVLTHVGDNHNDTECQRKFLKDQIL